MGRHRKHDRHLPARVSLEHGTYYFRDGKKPRISLGNDLGSAMQKYGQLIAENWTGVTIGDLIDRYRAEVLPAKKSAKNRDTENEQLNKIKIGFGHILPDNLAAREVFRYRDARRDKKTGKRVPVAARHEIVLLGHVLSKGIEWGVGTRNVIRTIKPGSGLKRVKRRHVPIEWVEQAKNLATDRMRLAMDWAIMIGQRRGDLLKLKFSDLLADGVYVRQGKTGAELLLTYSPAVNELIARSKAMLPHIPREYIIRKVNGRPYTPDGFSTNWQRLMKKHVEAGGERFSFHDLRSVSADGAETLEEARDRLGHTSSETTKRFYRRGVTKAKPRS